MSSRTTLSLRTAFVTLLSALLCFTMATPPAAHGFLLPQDEEEDSDLEDLDFDDLEDDDFDDDEDDEDDEDIFSGIDIHGFISQGYLLSKDNNYLGSTEDGSFEFNEAGINFRATLTDELSVGLQLFSRDLGDLGNNEVDLDWAFADYRHTDELGLRMGRFKIPYGFYNEIIDVDSARTSALLPQGVYNLSFRDVSVAANGLQAYGGLDAGDAGSLDYQAWVGTMYFDTEGSIAAAFDDDPATTSIDDFDIESAYGASLIYNTPLEGLRLGGSFFNLHNWTGSLSGVGVDPTSGATFPTATDFEFPDFFIWTASAEYQTGPWTFTAEYLQRDSDQESVTATPVGTFTSEGDLEHTGYYGMVSYELSEKWQIGAYFTAFRNPRDGVSNFTEYQRDFAVSLRYDINDYWLVKLEAHAIEGVQLVDLNDNEDVSSSSDLEEDWGLLVLKTTITF